ncbi:MAG: DUF362 domain-containing protein [bacterium]
MTKSNLIYVHPRVDHRGGIAQKLPELLLKAGLQEVVKSGDLVAVKMHLGEPGNIRYIRPVFPVLIVEALLALGAKPFVTDTAVLYRSNRHTAWDYYQAAKRHGFTSEVLGCPLIIAGGMGDRSVKVSPPQARRLKEVGVTSEIWDADVLISLAHVTLHLQYPLAGAIKNLGMGCVDIATKTAMHDAKGASPRQIAQYEATLDGAAAVLTKFKNKFLVVNLLLDVTPDCDCWNKSELPIVPDLGVIGGIDPVAVDQASHDMVRAASGYPGSKLEGTDGMKSGGDKVAPIYPKMPSDMYFELAANAGIGSSNYSLEEI